MGTTTSAELKIKYESLKEKWGELEKQLIEKIASTENEGLMDLFAEWQTLRNELNETVKLSWEAVLREQPKHEEANGYLCGEQALGESPLKKSSNKKPEWIKIEDGLPERGKAVVHFSQKRGMRIGAYHFMNWKENEVTHWMPVPDAPKIK